MKQHLTRRSMLRLTTASVAATLAAPAILRAQTSYPSRPLNMVIPFDTGGYNDRLARAFQPYLQEAIGQPINIINRGGAGAMLGHTYMLQQPDDGHTLACTSAAPYIPLNILIQNAPFALEDFHMINLPSRDYTLLATAVDSGIESIDVVIERLREDNSSVTIGVQPASADIVNLMLFLDANEISREGLRLVTYDGGGPTRNATAGNVVDIGLVGGQGFLPLAEQIKPLLIFDTEPRDGWDVQTVTGVVGADAEFVAGSQRGWVIHSSFVEKHPDHYEILLDAIREATEASADTLANQQLANTWYGPEESNEAFMRTARVMERHVDLLEGM
jgi:putative tricarboxylic transport membrane protein